MASRSATPSVDYPQTCMADPLALARASLRINSYDLPDFLQDTLSGLILSETATITLLSQLVRGLVAVSHELSRVTQKLISLTEENKALKEELNDLSSQIANLALPYTPPPPQDLSTLQLAIHNLSYRVTAPAPPCPPLL